jgi:hypothetical protein
MAASLADDVALDDDDPREAPHRWERLERVTRATLQRNLSRPLLDWTAFDDSALSATPRHREELRFLVTQIAYIEATSHRNLAALARAAPLPAVQGAFAAQIHDEIAHGAMMQRWLGLIGGAAKVHPAARFGCWSAEMTQHDAWLGVANAALLIELYAAALLDELLPKVQEPALRALIEHVQKDEHRHKVIALESIAALHAVGWHRRLLVRALGPLITQGTRTYFRLVFGHFLDRQAPEIGLPHRRILERALDEARTGIDAALAR